MSSNLQVLVTEGGILLEDEHMVPLNWTLRIATGHFKALTPQNAKTLNRSIGILAKVFALIHEERLGCWYTMEGRKSIYR